LVIDVENFYHGQLAFLLTRGSGITSIGLRR
jgi:hypothetical protein